MKSGGKLVQFEGTPKNCLFLIAAHQQLKHEGHEKSEHVRTKWGVAAQLFLVRGVTEDFLQKM
jgi:hypothetical protein